MNADALRNVLIGVIAALVGVLLLFAGFLVRVITEPSSTTVASPAATSVASPQQENVNVSGATVDEILRILREDFVEPDRVNSKYLYEGAINGLFQALGDPHSTYIDPQTYAISRDDFSGSFQGIGATVSQQGRFVVIVRPLSGTPAEAAGLKAGDVILAVDGENAEGWTVQQAVLKIRGRRGTRVELKVRHTDGREETLSIVRDEIQVASVSADPPGGALKDGKGNAVTDLAYLRIRTITRNTPKEIQEAVKAAEQAGKKGLIIDVRSNPGGLLQETTQLTDMFLEAGTMLVQVDRNGRERVANATPGQVTKLPIVIVQDELSASGAELFAAALQENGRAMVVGSKSLGKGTVNHVRELSNGGAVYVSIARWLTPKRNLIEGKGVQPDVAVQLTVEDIEAQRDVAMFRAIDVLREQIAMGQHRIPVKAAG